MERTLKWVFMSFKKTMKENENKWQPGWSSQHWKQKKGESWSQRWGIKESRWPSPPGQAENSFIPTPCPCRTHTISPEILPDVHSACDTPRRPPMLNIGVLRELHVTNYPAPKTKQKFDTSLHSPSGAKEKLICTISLCVGVFLFQVSGEIMMGGFLLSQRHHKITLSILWNHPYFPYDTAVMCF